MFRVRLVGLFLLLLFLTLPTASATPPYTHPWGVYLEPFVLYADSKGVLIGVQYNYYEEAGWTPNTLQPVEPWAYFIFYVNQTGAYYVDFMAFSGCEFPPFTFYHGWLYLFLLTSTNTSFPMRKPVVSNTVTVIRYKDGVIQRLGEVPWWIGSMNISMPYFLITKPGPREERFLYKIDDSVKLISTGENLTLSRGHFNPAYYLTLFYNFTRPSEGITFVNRECLLPKPTGDYVWLWPSHYRLPSREVNDTFKPMYLSCALLFNDGLLMVPSGISLGFANGSMWVGRNPMAITLQPGRGVPPGPLNVSLYLYKNGVWKKLPLLQVSEKGVVVLAPRLNYGRIPPAQSLIDWRFIGLFAFLFSFTFTAFAMGWKKT